MEKRCCRMQMRLTCEGVGMIKALAARAGLDRSGAVMKAVSEAWAQSENAADPFVRITGRGERGAGQVRGRGKGLGKGGKA
jgi:hypothetical protein